MMGLSDWDEIRMLMREIEARSKLVRTELEKPLMDRISFNAGEEIEVIEDLVNRCREAWGRIDFD